jgi:hypothetical protein
MTERSLLFRVHVREGVDFGPELQALTCKVTLGSSRRWTPCCMQRDRRASFDTLLQWAVTRQQWRRLSSQGQFFCKVEVFQHKPGAGGAGQGGGGAIASNNGDTPQPGTADKPLGWVVLDLRQAKLNHQYNKDQGVFPNGWRGATLCTTPLANSLVATVLLQ